MIKRNGEQITVYYSMTLEAMIVAGKYDRFDRDITAERFPTAGNGKVTLRPVLVHLNKVASTAEVLAVIAKRNLRPAMNAELLAYGATYPETQCKHPIVALGQSARIGGHVYSPYLNENDDKRKLNLNYVENDWNDNCRFLAFATFSVSLGQIAREF